LTYKYKHLFATHFKEIDIYSKKAKIVGSRKNNYARLFLFLPPYTIFATK